MYTIGFEQLLGIFIPIAIMIILMFYYVIKCDEERQKNYLPNWMVAVYFIMIFIFGVTWGSILF